MHKSDGVEGGFNLRHRQSPHDIGSTADSSMKHGQMSPACPTTPDKNMSQGGTPDPSASNSANKHSKRESYKAQKKTYRSQKKEAAKELLSTITDPAVVLLGDWLKVRGTLKSWTKLWCVLKPGVLVLYKSDKHKGSQWVGTILLNTCQLLERPSKKDGFCFKLFHPLDQSIWATKGPKGETIGAFVQPLPYSYCIFRAPSESAGKCWMDALELALKCTNLLKRSMTRLDNTSDALVEQDLDRSRHQDISWHPPSQSEDYHCSQNGSDHLPDGESDAFGPSYNSMRAQERSMNESDLERHFANQGAIRREGSFPDLAQEEKVCSPHKGTKGLSFDMSKKCDISQARRPLPPHEKAREESPCLTVGHSLIPRANEFCKTSETYKPPSGEPLWNQVKSECASVRNLEGQVNSQTVFENQSVYVKMPFSPKQKLCGTPLHIHQSSSRLAASKSAADQMHIPPVAKIKLYGNDNDQAKSNITFRPKNMRIEADHQDSLSKSLLLPADESGGPSGWVCSKNKVADCVVSNGSKLRIGDSVKVESTFNTVCELPKQEQVSSGGLSNALMAEHCGDVNEATQTTFGGEKNEISTCSFESRILDQQSTCSLFLFINHPLSSRSDPDHTVSSDVCRSTFPYRSEACQNKVSPCECRRLTVRNSNPDGGKTRIICTGCSQHDDTYTEPQTIKCRNQSNSSEEENSHSGSHSCLIYSDNKRKPESKSTAKADVQEQIGNRDTNPRTWINSERTSQSNNGDALKSFDTKVKMDCRSSDIAVKCNADDKKWKRIDCSNTISSALAESKSQSGCDDWTFIQEGLNLPSEADSASSDVTALCSPDISELSSKSLWASSLDLNESASSVDRNRSAHDRLSFRNRSLSRGSTLTSRTSSTSSGSQLHRHQKAHSSARGKKSAKGQGESAKYKKEGGGKGKGGGKKKDKGAEGGAADAKGEADDKKKKKKDKGGDKGDEAGDKKKKKKKGDEGKEEGDKAEEGGEAGKDKKKKKKKSDAGKAEGDKAEEGEEGGKDKKKKKKKSDAGKAEEGDAGEEDKKKKKKKKSKGEGEEESPAESDEGGKKKKKKKDKEKEGGAEPDTEVQESSQEISGILKTPSDTSMKEAEDISSEESGKEKEIKPSTGAEEAPEIKLEDVPQAVPISKPPSVSETTQTEEPEIAQAAAGGGFPPIAAGAAAAGYRDQSPFTPLSSASEPGSFGRYPYKRDDIVGRTTSTSENDDRVYEMPFCLGKDTWYQKEGPGLPHCQHHTEITKLCPKCLATLRNKDIYGTYSPQGDQQGEKPMFMSQRYKVTPVQDPQLIYQDREGPGMVIDDRGPDYTSQVPQSEFEGSPGAFRPMASGTAAPPYSSMAESGQYQKPYQPPGKKDRPGGRPTAEELNYALLALKIRKTRLETQKIELVKENLLLDLFMKEEKLNKEYGTDRWRRYLRSVPGSGKNPASSDDRQESQENLFASWGGQNESQNRQNSAMSLPHSDFQAGLKNSQLDDGSRAVLVACDQRIGSHSEDEGLNCNENGQNKVVKWPGGLGFESLAYLYQLKQEYEYPCMSSLAGSEIMEEPRDRTRLTTDIPTDTNIAQMKPDIRHSQGIHQDKQNQEAAGKMEGELIKSRKNGRVKKNWSFSFRGIRFRIK